VCENCLAPLVLKEGTPVWFIGKEVKNFLDYVKLNKEYCALFKKKGGNVHCCTEFLKQAWSGILDQVRSFSKESSARISKITLR